MALTPPPIPARCERRPTLGGFVKPWANVELADGGVDFRSAHQSRWLACWEHSLCQVCAEPVRHTVVLLGGPEQLLDLTFDEPPLHPECAVYTSRACPMVAGQRTHYVDRPRLSGGHRGATCSTPGCECGGWVANPFGDTAKDGKPAEEWFAVYVHNFALAVATDGSQRVVGGVVFPHQVTAIRRVSRPGEGRCWERVATDVALAHYRDPRTTTPH